MDEKRVIGECYYEANVPCPCCDSDECDAFEIVREYYGWK